MNVNVEKGKEYKIRGNSAYFNKKYGTPNPSIIIEDEDTAIFSGGWGVQQGNPACMLFAMRTGLEGLSTDEGRVYYGKIGYLGELVHESELKTTTIEPT